MKRKGIGINIILAIVIGVLLVMGVVFLIINMSSEGEKFGIGAIDDILGGIDKYAKCEDECENYQLDKTYSKRYKTACDEYYKAHPEECGE